MANQMQEKEGLWQRYKYLVFGLVGAILLMATLSVQNVVLYYETESEEKYAVKMDYSAFGMCIRCYPATDNADQIVEKAIFFGVGKKKSVLSAAEGLAEIAGKEQGTFLLRASGLLGNNDETTEELIEYLQAQGLKAEIAGE